MAIVAWGWSLSTVISVCVALTEQVSCVLEPCSQPYCSKYKKTAPYHKEYHPLLQPRPSQVCTPGVQPSEVYGAEHLVRLLVKLPELVPVWCMSPQDTLNLEVRLYDLMQWAAGEAQGSLFSTREEYKPNPDAAPELLLMGPGTGEATKATSLAAATPA